MSNLKITRERLPHEPLANSRLSSSSSQLYRLTLRPKPGSDAFRNLQAALRALHRRYDLDVIELRPIEDTNPRPVRAAVEQRRARHKATAYYQFFGGGHSLPGEWPDFSVVTGDDFTERR